MTSRRGGAALIFDPVMENVDRYLQLVKELDLKLVKDVDMPYQASACNRMSCPLNSR